MINKRLKWFIKIILEKLKCDILEKYLFWGLLKVKWILNGKICVLLDLG